MYDVAVIGGGPAGMMAAYRASRRGLKVVLYDPNRQLGRKLRITGKGRCNLTNNCDVASVMKNIPGDGRFLYSALNRFGPAEIMAFFESNGVPLKTERGNRVFPVSDNANDVADCLAGLLKDVTVEHRKLNKLEGARAYIIATGGLSYPKTGSDGDGYRFAREIGHTVIEPEASLVPLETSDNYDLQGFAPRNVVLRAYEDGKLIYREMGEMLFTHFGVSGPLVLSASSHMRKKAEYTLEIDMKPALDEKKLDARLLRDFEENPNKLLSNVLPGLVGKSMAPVMIQLLGFDKPCNSITREERIELRTLLKAFPVHVTGKRPVDEAIVTSGGVDTKEVNPRTMQSKLDERVYFCGEVLNLDAYTGGFNLTIAFATGFVAGEEVLCSQ